MQTIFFREHNRLARRIKQLRPNMSGDDIFTAAKLYNVAQWQKIVMYDWLPLVLGQTGWNNQIGSYSGPDASADPTLPNEFSNGAFRIGHTLLIDKFPQFDSSGNVHQILELRDMFESFHLMNNNRVNKMFRGLTRTFAKQKGRSIIDDVRNFLFLDPQVTVTLDLFALNLQRGREHGIPSYATLSDQLGVGVVNTFSDFVSDQDTVDRLDLAYGTDNVNACDAWVGIICEDPSDGVFGPVGVKIVGNTFRNIRDGDSMWYENIFPNKLIKEIEKTDIGDIIARNSDIDRDEMNDNAFMVL